MSLLIFVDSVRSITESFLSSNLHKKEQNLREEISNTSRVSKKFEIFVYGRGLRGGSEEILFDDVNSDGNE